MKSAGETDILVIGYGNELRGDDAVGPRIAGKVEEWHLPGVRAIACHQLTPELAQDIAGARTVIFVDASVEIEGDTAPVVRLEPAPASHFHAHLGDPRALLSLAQTLYGKSPAAWCAHVPAKNFEIGAPLSAEAQKGLSSALDQLKALCVSIARQS